MTLLGLLLAAVPFAFAGMRLLATGTDTRYLWMAVAATLGAAVILVWRGFPPTLVRTGLAVVAATAGAAVVAIALGAKAASGIVVVSVAFGLCSALGTGMVVRSRPRRSE